MSADISIPPPGTYAPPSITDYFQAPSVGMTPQTKEGHSFDNVLKKAMTPPGVNVEFTKHAQERMKTRGIDLEVEDLVKLNNAIDQAQSKGAREALVMLDGNAMVVDVNHRTVITALNKAETQSNVFTQIDSAVILP